MIPNLRLSRDFQLVTKPSYLNRLIRRHAPIALPPNESDDKNSTPQEQSNIQVLEQSSSLNPTLILEKCDSLLTQKRQSSNLEYSMNDETEDRTSNGQNSTILVTVTVTSEPTNEISTINDANGQNVAIARKETGLLQNSGPDLVKAVNNVESTISTPMQPIVSQTNEPQHESFDENIEGRASTRSNIGTNQISNLTEINYMNQNDSVMNLPLSTASKSSEGITMNCDVEELLDKCQNRIRERQRIYRKIILKREGAHLMEVNRLKSMVNVLKKKNHKLHMNKNKREEQHNEQLKSMLQNAIDETKRKKWCWNCQIELKHVVFNIPMCKDCLNQNW